MLGQGRGRQAVAQILILIQYSYIFSLWLGSLVHLLFHRGSLSLYETCSGTEQCGAFIGSKKASWHSTNRYRVKEMCETLTTMLFALMTLMEVVRKSLLPVFTILSSYPCQPCNSYHVSSENLVLDQLVIHKLIFFFILNTHPVDIVLTL